MRLNVCFNEMALFGYWGHLQLLSKVVAAMAEMEVSSQEEMPSPKAMKVFAVERSGLCEDFVSFPALCVECNRRHSYLLRLPFVRGPLQW